MKNLNEPHKQDQNVIAFEHRSAVPKETNQPLLPTRQIEDLRNQWTAVQWSFVDEPRKAVEEADQLVGSAIKQIEEVFAAERANLEKQWSRGEEVSTEDLRVCLQRYREFFDRLVSHL
jgi:hypothetical protein